MRGKLILLVVCSVGADGVLNYLPANRGGSLAAGLAALVVGLIVAWRLQRTITTPVLAVTRSMDEIQHGGDFNRHVDVPAEGEIADLVHGFNRMTAEIRTRDVAIAAHRVALESEVAARTADLSAAKAAAERANAAKLDALAAVSHEIRAPMNGIMVMAEMIAAADVAPRQRRSAEVIAKSGSSLLAIINDILDVSKVEAGEMALEAAPVDFADVVEDVCALFWEPAAAKGLDLAAYIDPATPRLISADAVRLRQVVGALVNNAIKFTERGGVLVEVEPDGEATLRISVRDTGVGIAEQEIGGVFGALSQADPSTASKSGDTALGLAICKRRVEAMGGRVSVASQVGRGSTFGVHLPLVAVQAATPWPNAAKRHGQADLVVQGLSSRRALSRYLGHAGLSIAAPGAPADLCIADAEALKLQLAGSTPTVGLSRGDESAAYELKHAGAAQAVLLQPFRRADLEALLHRLSLGQPLTDPQLACAPNVQPEPTPVGGLTPNPVVLSASAALKAAGDDLIDPDVAARLADMVLAGRGDFVTRIYDLYRDSAPDALNQIASAGPGEAPAASIAAHALKSMSFNVGAKAVAILADEIERAARQGVVPAQDAVSHLRDLLGATLMRLGPTPSRPPVAAAARAVITPADAELLHALEHALEHDQLALGYQPQVDRDGENIVGVEALLRWVHPVRGPISPAVFIPLAETHGMISRVTDWVVDRMLAETCYLKGLQVAFNASAIEFAEEGFVERLTSRIDRHGYDPRRLEVEITETAILQNEAAVRKNIDRLRALGMKVALDDFGAGYSSLGHLRRYPFDKLKIDREFITDCSRDMQAATVVHAVVSIGRALGMKVIAEGVETETQRKFLRVAGVHAMQGYLFGKAVSIDELTAMLAAPARLQRA